MVEICVEDLAKCEYKECEQFFSTEDESPHEKIKNKRKCEWCGRKLTWKSFGMEPVNAGNVYYKTKWIGPGGVWVNEKPTESFSIKEGGWWVVPGIDPDPRPGLPKEALREYVVWCQVWNRVILNNEDKPEKRREGYSLHRTLEDLRRFIFHKKNEDEDMKVSGDPYTCRVPHYQFEQITKPKEMCGMFYPNSYDAPERHDRKRFGENVFEMIVAA